MLMTQDIHDALLRDPHYWQPTSKLDIFDICNGEGVLHARLDDTAARDLIEVSPESQDVQVQS